MLCCHCCRQWLMTTTSLSLLSSSSWLTKSGLNWLHLIFREFVWMCSHQASGAWESCLLRWCTLWHPSWPPFHRINYRFLSNITSIWYFKFNLICLGFLTDFILFLFDFKTKIKNKKWFKRFFLILTTSYQLKKWTFCIAILIFKNLELWKAWSYLYFKLKIYIL